MRILLLALILLTAAIALSACDIETKPADPNLLLPPGDRPPPVPGLFTGEKGHIELLSL
jgi:hypothetical protein